MSLDLNKIRASFEEFDFTEMFVELGWNHPGQNNKGRVTIGDEEHTYEYIAKGARIPVVRFDLNKYSKAKEIHKKFKERYPEHLCVFSDNKTQSAFTRYDSQSKKVYPHRWFKGENSDWILRKFDSIAHSFDEETTFVEARQRLKDAFNTEEVTKKFFNQFKENHSDFQKHIVGIKDEEDKKIYSLVILNRLMFIWFLQVKGFLDDQNYLIKKMKEIRRRKGKDKFYSYFLKLLFFEGFAKRPNARSEDAKKELKDVEYLNGGLFTPHPVEDKYKKIEIKDKAFEKTFKLFGEYDWHKEDNKGGSEEISADVLGHIFEKYINDMQRKQAGAYYTRDEITRFFSKNAIEQTILDKLVLKNKKYKYKSIDELKGALDADICRVLLADEDSILNNLTILDPAVGSGAFLISTLNKLMDVYRVIIEKIKVLDDPKLNIWFEDFKKKHKSVNYGIKKCIILNNLYGVDIMEEATEVCKLRLFLSLVSSALNKQELEPLPNIDFNIMCGDSLVGLLKETAEGENFSFISQNYGEILDEYNSKVQKYKNSNLSFEDLKKLKTKTREFIKSKRKELDNVLYEKHLQNTIFKKPVVSLSGDVQEQDERVLAQDINKFNCLHWDFVFNKTIKSGGFDIILTNPPWDKVKFDEKEFLKIPKKKTPKKEVEKRLRKVLGDGEGREKLLKEKNLCALRSSIYKKIYKHQSGKIIETNGRVRRSGSDMDLYRVFFERCFNLLKNNGHMGIVLPSGIYKDDGAVGLRREILFKKMEIKEMMDFQNQLNEGKVFDDVDSRFKISLWNLKKSEPKRFDTLFSQRNLNALEKSCRNKNSIVSFSIDQIKELSPREMSLPEFKNKKELSILEKEESFDKVSQSGRSSWGIKLYSEFDSSDFGSSRVKILSSDEREKGFLKFYKGRNIDQYNFKYKKHKKVPKSNDQTQRDMYVNEQSKAFQVKGGFAFENKLYRTYRLVIRRMASATNERSLISCILPRGSVFDRTLTGVCILSDSKLKNKYMLVFQALLNNFTVDSFVRRKIGSVVSIKFIESLNIPRLNEKDEFFDELVEKSAQLTCIGKEFDDLADEVGIKRGGVTDIEKRYALQGEIDAMVAHVYGLNLDEYKYILSTFTTGNNQDRLKKLKKYALVHFEKIKNQKKSSVKDQKRAVASSQRSLNQDHRGDINSDQENVSAALETDQDHKKVTDNSKESSVQCFSENLVSDKDETNDKKAS